MLIFPLRSVVILGDGNLSFCLSFAKLYPNYRILGTVIESDYESFTRKYPSGVETLRRIETECKNASIQFGVDATNLKLRSNVTDIIMNFPHPGGKTNLAKNRQLLRGIFNSVSTTLRQMSARFHLALASRQSGLENSIDVVFTKQMPKHNPDSWQAIYLAAEFGLFLRNRRRFLSKKFVDYRPAGYLSRDQAFHNENQAEILTFEAFRFDADATNFDDKILQKMNILEKSTSFFWIKRDFLPMFHTYFPYHRHDISILYSLKGLNLCGRVEEATIDEMERNDFRALIVEIAGELIIDFWEIRHLRGRCPHTNAESRIYRLCWQSWTFPISKKMASRLQDEFRDILKLRLELIKPQFGELH